MINPGGGYPVDGGGGDGQEVRQQSAVALGVREQKDVGAPVGSPQPEVQAVPVAAAQDGHEEGPALEVEGDVSFRCPIGRGGLLLKLLGAHVATVDRTSNLIEVACRSCRDDARRGGRPALQVLHRFGMDGAHVETVETRAGDV